MEVEDPIREGVEERGVQAPHEPGEQDHLDAARRERVTPGTLVLEPGAEAAGRREHGLDAETARALEDRGLRVVAQQGDDAPPQLAAALGEHQRLEVRPLS